jgi:phosphoglycolate phosphatase
LDRIKGVVFDKDGTLFDFRATWGHWTTAVIAALAAGDAGRAAALAEALGYDPETRAFRTDSAVIAQTNGEIRDLIMTVLPGHEPAELLALLNRHGAQCPQVEAVPLRPLMARLRGMGLKIGLATNDAEVAAQAHLAGAEIADQFDFVAGFDSGWGGKPAPGQLLAFLDRAGLQADETIMVGDSLHDLEAGRAAGMRRVAVLTGMADTDELAPHSDVVLADVGHLPGWIAAQSRVQSGG